MATKKRPAAKKHESASPHQHDAPEKDIARRKAKPKSPEYAAVLGAARDVVAHFRTEGHDGSQARNDEGEVGCCQCWTVNRLQDALNDFEAAALERLSK